MVPSSTAAVVIAIDMRKALWTAAVIDSVLNPLQSLGSRSVLTVTVRRFVQQWSNAVWAVEGAAGLGAPLTREPTADRVQRGRLAPRCWHFGPVTHRSNHRHQTTGDYVA